MNAIEKIKTTKDNSNVMKFNGITFWTNEKNVVMYIPSGEWNITQQLVKAGLAVYKTYKNCWGHTECIVTA